MRQRPFELKTSLITTTVVFAALATTACVANGQPLVGTGAPAAEAPHESSTLSLSRIDFASGAITPWATDATVSRTSIDGDFGDAADMRLSLPQTGPALPARGSRFSTLMRARDLFDLEAYPARVVAKLYRLNAEGVRQGTSCTAQFVGPRHLLTASHCLMDRTTGRVHPGFEIALRFDGGKNHGVLGVTTAWMPTEMTTMRPLVVQTTGPVDNAANCNDVALIGVDEPAGLELGWLGMSSVTDPSVTLHRFSYPNESAAAVLERQLQTIDSDNIRSALQEALASSRLKEPDFSPDNLYYEYGAPDQVHQEALSERNGAILPGRSGSAMIDGRGHVLGIMSSATLGVNYSCRLTPELIGAFATIAGRDAERHR